MSIPLTLGVPHRPDPEALVAGLLHRSANSATGLTAVTTGPPVVRASAIRDLPADAALGRIVIELDVDPGDLRGTKASYEAVRFHVDVDSSTIDDALALRLPSPLVVFGEPELEAVTQIVEGHRIPGFSSAASPRQIADVLAVVAHADVGVVARADNSKHVAALLAATVAALRGDDIPTAWANPDTTALAALRPEAAEAVRGVLLGIEVDDPRTAHEELVAAGLVVGESA